MSKNINDGYRLAHTMIRVKDLEASFNFYCKTLGMKVLRKQIILTENLQMPLLAMDLKQSLLV